MLAETGGAHKPDRQIRFRDGARRIRTGRDICTQIDCTQRQMGYDVRRGSTYGEWQASIAVGGIIKWVCVAACGCLGLVSWPYFALWRFSRARRARASLNDCSPRILRDPHNIELNLRYARLAESNDEERKALAAYERVLEADPSNSEAARALHRIRINLIPVVTGGRIELGARYETNARQLPKGARRDDDVAGFRQALHPRPAPAHEP